jgi:hypothetical protein
MSYPKYQKKIGDVISYHVSGAPDRKLKNSEFLYIFTMNDTSTYVQGKTNQSN